MNYITRKQNMEKRKEQNKIMLTLNNKSLEKKIEGYTMNKCLSCDSKEAKPYCILFESYLKSDVCKWGVIAYNEYKKQ